MFQLFLVETLHIVCDYFNESLLSLIIMSHDHVTTAVNLKVLLSVFHIG